MRPVSLVTSSLSSEDAKNIVGGIAVNAAAASDR